MFMQPISRQTLTAPANTTPMTNLASGGMVAGTLIETDTGWRPVETLKPQDRVATFDGGLRPVRAVTRRGIGGQGHALNLIQVPGGALETCSDLLLPAEQGVLLDLPQSEARFGTPLVLVPASALVGWQGVRVARCARSLTVIDLQFEDDEVIYANTGALIHCPVNGDPLSDDGFFLRLGYDAARDLLGLDRRPAPAGVARPRVLRVA